MGIKDWIALLKGSQLLADALDPKTMLVAKKYKFSAIKPKAPVRSACILGKRKHAVISANARNIFICG
jgi:hypothetical protein